MSDPEPEPDPTEPKVSEHGTTIKTVTGGTVTSSTGQLVAAPTSTEEEDRVSAGQRAVNMIWETTQMKIALSVIWSALGVAAWLAVGGNQDAQVAAFVFLYGVANLVTGFYFGRTNHQKIGGVLQGR
jgi:hypothetical protein